MLVNNENCISTNCPSCAEHLNSFQWADNGEEERPMAGDILICYHCTEVFKLDKNLMLKEIDIQKLADELQEVIKTIHSAMRPAMRMK